MAEALTWRLVTAAQLQGLAQLHTIDECKAELSNIFKLADPQDPRQQLLLDLHVVLASFFVVDNTFCRQQHFQKEQTSVLLGLLETLIQRDLCATSTTTLEASYERFESLLLAHSVPRPPRTVQLFSMSEVAAIVDFVTHSYYRHLQLYKCIFTPFQRVVLVQRQPNDVEVPTAPRSLAEALQHLTIDNGSNSNQEPTMAEAPAPLVAGT